MRNLFDRLFGAKPIRQVPEMDFPRIPAYVPPDRQYRFIALDVETANRNTASICQIGLATCDEHGIVQTYGTLIDPRASFDLGNIDIHGIKPSAVRGKPTFSEAFGHLFPVLSKSVIFQHSTFDSTAITSACIAAGLPVPRLDWRDSVKVAQRAWPELRGNGGHGLANLRTAFGLDFRHHNALEDARASAEIVLLAEQHTGQTFGEILAPRRAEKTYSGHVRAEGSADGPLFGHIAVFTGALSFSREEAASHAASAGISVKTSVSSKTTLLVVGDQDLTFLAGHSKSSKHRKAEELIAQGVTIRIIGETEFLALIGKG